MSDNRQMSVAMQRLVDFIIMVTNSTLLRRVRVRVTLQLTVSQSVCLGVEPNLGLLTRDFFFFFLLQFNVAALSRASDKTRWPRELSTPVRPCPILRTQCAT
jgi:hypothetical protein